MVTLWGVDPGSPNVTEDQQTYAITAPLAIGTTNQPKMIWTLFSSSIPTGGVVAVEDKGHLGISRGLGYANTPVLPMNSPSGGQIRYLLEPDFPMIWNPFMRASGSSIDLDYNSGTIDVRIENPDGTIVDLGGAPFSGPRGIGATTLQDRFAYSFSSYGLHRIELTGWIKDTSNQTYVGGGVYDIYVAQPITIDTNVLPGTPYTKNEYFDPGFQLYPPVPADVKITWELDEQSQLAPTIESFDVRANRWGYYTPPILAGRDRFARATQVQFGQPGEYKVTFQATYREQDGTLWMGEKVLTGIVLPDDPIVMASRPPAAGSFSITSDARYVPAPSDTGDTVILPVNTTANLPTYYTFPVGFFVGDQIGFRTDDAALQEIDSGATGTFVAPAFASSTGLFPFAYSEDIDRRGYICSIAARADSYHQVKITEGSPYTHLPFPNYPWNPSELAVDAAGDIYHFWSSMVYRDVTANSTRYGYYSSGIVLSDSVPTMRAHRAGDGLVSDGWGVRNLLLHNLAVRPGSIVGEGDSFTAGAYFLPLPPQSTVEFKVTPPGGDTLTVNIVTGNSGYACDMGERFELDRQGVWTVTSTLIQGAETGGILGVGFEDPWEFYVINPGNDSPIEFHLPFQSPIDTTSDLLVLSGDLTEPDILTGTVHVSATFNGAVIEQTERELDDGRFVYSIDLSQISNSYSNYDPLDARDRLVMTFFVNGQNSQGERRMAARMVYAQNGILYTGEKDFSPIDPQTREERLQDIAEEAESAEAHEVRGRVPLPEEDAE